MFSVIQKILFNVALFLAILLSNALIIINTDSFYEFEFNKNNTSLKTGINHNDLFIVVDNIQDFFNEKSNEKIQMTTYINGIEKKLFNSKEIRHMIDVKNLILNIKFFNYLLWTTVIVILLIKISLSKDKILNTFRVIAKSYFIYSVSILISALILLALSFRWIFYFFHIISFNNNLWILDPRTDYLIKIFEEDTPGQFGEFGGKFIPETLSFAIEELENEYSKISTSESFQNSFNNLLKEFVGRPTPLYFAKNLSNHYKGPKIYLKREDLAHLGAHKINNAVGQGLLAKQMGKQRIIAETGAGQHGVATAAICARLGMDCIVYMGEEDIKRQALNVYRMKLLGAKVVSVNTGSKTLKDAINEAMRDWVTNVTNSYYLIGSVIGPHPYPTMVRDFQKIIGIETKKEI